MRGAALGKRELWKRWYTRMFKRLWGVIPLNRGEVDTGAMRAAGRALDSGLYVGIAPEGTRSKSGVLSRGHPGVAFIAARREVTNEIMYELARDLPEARRGPYAAIPSGPPRYLTYI